MDDRERLIRETWALNRDIGYAKFRSEFFTDDAVMKKWPDPAVRERELRDFWNEDAHTHYPQYHENTAKMSDERLMGYRDQLQGVLASWNQNAWLPSPAEICEHLRDNTGGSETIVPRKGLKALFAEWDADYAARRAEDAQPRLRSSGESAAVTRDGWDEGRGR